MKLKLDENLGRRGVAQLKAAGHDVSTVEDQRLCGAADARLLAICTSEGRALITLDMDFANPIRFPPALHAGVGVIRLPPQVRWGDVDRTMATLVAGLSRAELRQGLWIVSIDRIRI